MPTGAMIEDFTKRDWEITALLLQGCSNPEIAYELKMPVRTVKSHFNRMFMRLGIRSGAKRVHLAVAMYRRQLCLEGKSIALSLPKKPKSSPASQEGLKTKRLPQSSEPPSTLSKTTYATHFLSSDSLIVSNLHFGMKPVERRNQYHE
jgi:DNA-binding CsgD family transcriptional regulator